MKKHICLAGVLLLLGTPIVAAETVTSDKLIKANFVYELADGHAFVKFSAPNKVYFRTKAASAGDYGDNKGAFSIKKKDIHISVKDVVTQKTQKLVCHLLANKNALYSIAFQCKGDV